MAEVYELPQYFFGPEIILSLLALSGLVLNLKVAHVIYKAPLAPDTLLMRFIVLFDIIACLFTFPYQFFRLTHPFDESWCIMDLVVFSTSTFASLVATSALSFIRYLTLVKNYNILLGNSFLLTIIYTIMVWTTIIIRSFYQDLIIMPSGMYCMPYTPNPSTITMILDGIYVILLLPCPFIIILSYLAVSLKYKRVIDQRSHRAVLLACGDLVHSPTIHHQIQKNIIKRQNSHYRHNLTKLILITVTYTVIVTPEYSLSFGTMFFNLYRTCLADYVAFILMFTFSLVNPLFVLHTHEPITRSNKHTSRVNLI